MRALTAGILSTALAVSASCRGISLHTHEARNLLARSFAANAPNGYMPTISDCPSDEPSIRNAGELSQEEQSWLEQRRPATIEPMRDLLGRMNIAGLDTDEYINTHRDNTSALPNIAIAASGGGYRAMLNGAGVIEAFDSRTPNSTARGQLGGLLQSATYVAGLSGGGWLVGTLYANNFTSVYDIVTQNPDSDSENNIWQLGNSIFEGPEGDTIQLLSSAGYYDTLLDNVQNKEDEGFNTTLTDYWGRALSFQLVNASNGGPAYTFSSIARQSWFTDATVPMPFLVADERFPGDIAIPSNTTVYDFNPWEIGSPDPTLYAYAPLRYAGTNFTSGSPTSDQCVTGYDNVGFVMGTSSSLFNQVLIRANNTDTSNPFSAALWDGITSVIQGISSGDEDIADWVNPFYHYHPATNPNADSRQLTLVDGGEDLQNIPFHPITQPNRHVDVIFAIDSSGDTNTSYVPGTTAANWPAGVAMMATYQRSLSDIANGTDFPSVPDPQTFVNLGLNNRPTFFGCDSGNFSDDATAVPPLVVYLPNAPYVYTSNVSTFDLDYNETERNAIVANGYALATQGNSTLDENWPACVGCAILSRSLERTNTDVPDVCSQCFDKYCWDGSTDSSQTDYVPGYKLGANEVVDVSLASRVSGQGLVAVGAAAVAAWALL